MKLVYAAIAALALLALAFGGGYAVRDRAAATSLAAANAAAKTCSDNAADAEARIDYLYGRLSDLQTRHEAALREATAALDARDADIARLTADAARRADAIRETVHATPDCADLARVPVCAAVADRLWPPAAAAAAAAAHDNG